MRKTISSNEFARVVFSFVWIRPAAERIFPVLNAFRRSADLFAVVPQCGTKEKALAKVDQSVLIRVYPRLKLVLNSVNFRVFGG